MGNPYTEAAMSYAHWVRSWAGLGYLVVGGILASLFVLFAFDRAARGECSFPLIVEVSLFLVIATHIREQFSHPRSRLIPNYHRVHATVAAAAALIVAVLLPAIFTLLAGWRSVGFIAIAVCLFGAVLCSARAWQTWWPWMFFLVMLAAIRPVREALDPLMSGQFELGAFALLLLGMAITLHAGFRLLHLAEESQEHCSGNQSDDGVSWLPRMSRLWLADRPTVRLIRHARRAATSRWSRVCRWQTGMSSGWSVCRQCLAIMLGFLFLDRFAGLEGSRLLWLFVLLALVTPLASWKGARFEERASVTPRELLMPVCRPAYLKQLGMAAALSQFQSWAAISIVMTLWWFVGLQSQVPGACIVSILLITALSQFWLFGSAVLLSLQRSRLTITSWAIAIVTIVSLMAAGTIAQPETEFQFRIMALSTFLAFLGLLATWAAYRHLLVADFD